MHPLLGFGIHNVSWHQRIYVVGGTYPVDKWLENVFRKESEIWKDRLAIRDLGDLPLEKILSEAGLKQRAVAVAFQCSGFEQSFYRS